MPVFRIRLPHFGGILRDGDRAFRCHHLEMTLDATSDVRLTCCASPDARTSLLTGKTRRRNAMSLRFSTIRGRRRSGLSALFLCFLAKPGHSLLLPLVVTRLVVRLLDTILLQKERITLRVDDTLAVHTLSGCRLSGRLL